jgi:hypothetical protein
MGTGQLLTVPRSPLCSSSTIDLSLLTFFSDQADFLELQAALTFASFG